MTKAESNKRYRQTHKEEIARYNKEYCAKHREAKRANRTRFNQKVRLEALIHYAQSNPPKCAQCSIDDIDVLCFDHIAGDGYKTRRESGNLAYRLRLAGYPKGFQVLCANCNLKKAKQLGELEKRKDEI